MIIRTEKYCPRCYRTKPAKEFALHSKAPDGLQGYCKTCSSEHLKMLRETDPKHKERQRAYDRKRHRMMVNGQLPHRAAAATACRCTCARTRGASC